MDRKIILEENEEEQEEIKYLSIYMLSSVKLYNYIYNHDFLNDCNIFLNHL